MRNYDHFPEQKSEPVHLERGKVYYIEAVFKAAAGGDYMGVAWEYPGQERTEIAGDHLSTVADGPRGGLTTRSWHNINGNKAEDLVSDPRFCRG